MNINCIRTGRKRENDKNIITQAQAYAQLLRIHVFFLIQLVAIYGLGHRTSFRTYT